MAELGQPSPESQVKKGFKVKQTLKVFFDVDAVCLCDFYTVQEERHGCCYRIWAVKVKFGKGYISALIKVQSRNYNKDHSVMKYKGSEINLFC